MRASRASGSGEVYGVGFSKQRRYFLSRAIALPWLHKEYDIRNWVVEMSGAC
jgi:hypothetical protein